MDCYSFCCCCCSWICNICKYINILQCYKPSRWKRKKNRWRVPFKTIAACKTSCQSEAGQQKMKSTFDECVNMLVKFFQTRKKAKWKTYEWSRFLHDFFRPMWSSLWHYIFMCLSNVYVYIVKYIHVYVSVCVYIIA